MSIRGAFGNLYRLMIAGFLAAAVGGAAWLVHRYGSREEEIRILKEIVERLEAERRVADVTGVETLRDAYTGDPLVRFRFQEYGPDGTALPARTFTVAGREVYFDALVIQFDREHVKAGDALRGKSLLLYRRVFGDRQRPADGVPVDAGSPDGVPAAYRLSPGAAGVFERELWADFWSLAADPAGAAAAGVRVAQGEAVYARLETGKAYRLTIDQAGGVLIRPRP